MSPTFTVDDVGKPVESEGGETLGAVVAVDEGTAYVEPDPGLADSTRAVLDWERSSDDAVPLADEAVSEVTDDAIRLEASFPDESITTGATDDSRSGGRTEGADRRADDYAPGEPVASDATEIETGVDGTGPDAGTGDLDEADPTTDDGYYDSPEGGPRTDPDAEMDATERRDADSAATEDEMESIEAEASRELEVDPTELTDGDPEVDVESGEDVGQRTGGTDPDDRRGHVEPRGPTAEDAGAADADVDPERDGDDLERNGDSADDERSVSTDERTERDDRDRENGR